MWSDTKLTEEELDYVTYAIEREATEEGTLFAECRMLQKSPSILQKLLGISDERYNQLTNTLHDNPEFKEADWSELLHRHGLHWEESELSESCISTLQGIANNCRCEAEIEVRFRILINGIKYGFKQEEYKDFIESDGYYLSDFQHVLDSYGDKFISRLVRKLPEYKKEQESLEELKKENRKLPFLFIALTIVMIAFIFLLDFCVEHNLMYVVMLTFILLLLAWIFS